MINPIGELILQFPATAIEWAPTKWSDRKAWGPQAQDGFYVTKAGEVYRLEGNVVIFVIGEQKQ